MFGSMALGGWDKQHRIRGGKEWTYIFEPTQKVRPPRCVVHALPKCRQAVCRCWVVRLRRCDSTAMMAII